MIPLSQVTLFYSFKSFKFHSPVRTYLQVLSIYFPSKTTEIKQRQQLHQTLTAKLSTQIHKGTHTHSKTLTKLTRRASIQYNDRTQQLWDTLKAKTIFEPYNKESLQELFFDLLKDQNFINDYEFSITSKQSFTHFKSYFITVLFHEPDLMKYLYKLESLRMPHLQTLSLHQELKGFFGLNQLLQQFYGRLKADITIREYLSGREYEDIKVLWIDMATHLMQPQDSNQKIYNAIKQYAENNKLNHVHYSNFKHMLYKQLVQSKISKRGIKKVLKIVDSLKSAVMRSERVMDVIASNYQYLIYCMVSDKKNESFQRRAIDLILEYLYNNDHRALKKNDLKPYACVQQPMQKVISRIAASPLLLQDFQQDLNSIFTQRLQIKRSSVAELSTQLKQIPFFMQLYEDHDVQVQTLLETEIDFALSNRTHFRRKEIELIHHNMNISNEVFDLFLMRMQDCLSGVPTKAILNRMNQYRTWVVNDKIKTNEIY